MPFFPLGKMVASAIYFIHTFIKKFWDNLYKATIKVLEPIVSTLAAPLKIGAGFASEASDKPVVTTIALSAAITTNMIFHGAALRLATVVTFAPMALYVFAAKITPYDHDVYVAEQQAGATPGPRWVVLRVGSWLICGIAALMLPSVIHVTQQIGMVMGACLGVAAVYICLAFFKPPMPTALPEVGVTHGDAGEAKEEEPAQLYHPISTT